MTETFARPEVSSLRPLLHDPKARAAQKRRSALRSMRQEAGRRMSAWLHRLGVQPPVVSFQTIRGEDGDAMHAVAEVRDPDDMEPSQRFEIVIFRDAAGGVYEPTFHATAICPMCDRELHLAGPDGAAPVDRRELHRALDRAAAHVADCPGDWQ